MQIESNPYVRRLKMQYSSGSPVDFAAVVGEADLADESLIADAIFADAECRRDRNLPVTLDRYLAAVPWLRSSTVSLDAAIEVTLIATAGTAEDSSRLRDAVVALKATHPALAGDIERTAAISELLVESLGVPELQRSQPTLRLPVDFGSPDLDGRPRYTLLSVLGTGSQSTVYLAADRLLSDERHAALVAVKRLTSAREATNARAGMEASRARRVQHASVARILDRGVDDAGHPYLVYERIAGQSFDEWLMRVEPAVRPAAAIRVLAAVAEGVQAIHAAGVVHLDLKPSNILVDIEGHPRVTDFGIAELKDPDQHTGRYGCKGTLAFMAPEQAALSDFAPSPASDVYALGGVLYWALTGEFPNGRSTGDALANLHDASRWGAWHEYAAIPQDLAAICRRAMAHRPEDRYSSADAFAEDLRRYTQRRPVIARPSPLWRRGLLAISRHRVAAATAVLAVTLGAIAIASVTRSAERAERAQVESRLAIESERLQSSEEKRAVAASMFRAYLKSMPTGVDSIDDTSWVPTFAVLELMTGRGVLDAPDDVAAGWDSRIATVGDRLRLAEEQGLAGTLEHVLWRHTLAEWLALDGQLAAAVDEADISLDGYRKLGVAEADPLTVRLRRLRDEWVQRLVGTDGAG